MNKTYTVMVKINSTASIIRYEQAMGILDAVVKRHLPTRVTCRQIQLSEHAHTYLMLSEEAGLYHRVKWDVIRQCVWCASCRSAGCEHARKHPMYCTAS